MILSIPCHESLKKSVFKFINLLSRNLCIEEYLKELGFIKIENSPNSVLGTSTYRYYKINKDKKYPLLTVITDPSGFYIALSHSNIKRKILEKLKDEEDNILILQNDSNYITNCFNTINKMFVVVNRIYNKPLRNTNV